MALSQRGDSWIPSIHGNMNFSSNNFSRLRHTRDHSARTAEGAVSLSSSSRNDCNANALRLNKNGKTKKIIRSALKTKNIGGNGSFKNSTRDLRLCSENEDISSVSSWTLSQLDDDEDDEKTYRNEMYLNERVNDSLKKKYVCLNFEFNQLQERHDNSDSSANALERKYTQVFRSHQIPEGQQPKKLIKTNKFRQKDKNEISDKENIPKANDSSKELKLILKTLKKMFKSPPGVSRDTGELRKLYEIVKTLQDEQEKFRNLIIKEQQDQLNSFHSKYLEAQKFIQSQEYEIKQLHSTNAQLENELNVNMKSLKEQFKNKIQEVSYLPRVSKADKMKADKLSKDNSSLISKHQQVKQELFEARAKLEEAVQKRVKTLNKLKTSERDLKIFRTQNNILKTEKRSLFEELGKLKGLNDDLKTTSSKNLSRQKERGETMQRLLRKKIIDLEVELNQSRNSTNVLMEERDKQVADLNMQLNTLVHNFEVSQKHIRILRRHIYSLTGGKTIPVKVT